MNTREVVAKAGCFPEN